MWAKKQKCQPAAQIELNIFASVQGRNNQLRDPSDFFLILILMFRDKRPTGQRQSTGGNWPPGKFLSCREEVSQLGFEPDPSGFQTSTGLHVDIF